MNDCFGEVGITIIIGLLLFTGWFVAYLFASKHDISDEEWIEVKKEEYKDE